MIDDLCEEDGIDEVSTTYKDQAMDLPPQPPRSITNDSIVDETKVVCSLSRDSKDKATKKMKEMQSNAFVVYKDLNYAEAMQSTERDQRLGV